MVVYVSVYFCFYSVVPVGEIFLAFDKCVKFAAVFAVFSFV